MHQAVYKCLMKGYNVKDITNPIMGKTVGPCTKNKYIQFGHCIK